MRTRLATIAVVLLAVSVTASAGTITSISPSTVKVNSGEHFITVYGSGLGNVLVFDGPAGHFERTVTASFSGSVVGWVPEAIVRTSGYHSLYVRGGTGDSNSVTFTVQGFKYFPLVILHTDILFAQPNNREGGYVKYDVVAFGGEDPFPSVRCFPESGSWFPMGRSTVNCEASNNQGETAKSDFVIHVADRVAPKVEVPREPIVLKAESREGAIAQFSSAAYDDIYGELKPECTPRSGSMFPVGKTTVQCSATDWDGNIGYGTFLVEVVGEVKPYELTVKVPSGLYADADDPRGAPVKFSVTVLGTRDPAPELTCSHKSGEIFPIGDTKVVCNAIDMYGMRGSADFVISVADPAPPSIVRLIASPNVLPYDNRVYPIRIDVSAEDKIDLAPFCAIFSVTSNEDIDIDDDDSEKEWDWSVTGDLTIDLRARYTRSTRVYNVWVGCSDWFGNRSALSVPVYVTKDGTLASAIQPPSRRRSVGKP